MGDKARILIIDDEEDICLFSKSALEKTGRYEVFFSLKAREGLDQSSKDKPDLILLDMRMPEMDGSELARHLSENETTRDIPVVFLSAMAAPAAFLVSMFQDEKQETRKGGYYFIQKPIASNELVNRIDSILKEKQR